MSESDSVQSSTFASSENTTTFTGTTIPLFLTSAYQDENQRNPEHVLPRLPSHRFRFSVWHDVAHIDVTGDKLRAPRVRGGPPQKEALFYRLRDENDKRIHHTFQGNERRKYQHSKENWEAALHVSLCFQELEHDYQRAELIRVLKRLPSAQQIVLINNELVDMKSISFPKCTYLDLTMNQLLSFASLPHLPCIRYLKLAQNAIHNFNGLRKLRNSPLEHLILKENPIAFSVLYRQTVFEILPQLKYLDGIPKRAQDTQSADLPVVHGDSPIGESIYLANKSRTPPRSHDCIIL